MRQKQIISIPEDVKRHLQKQDNMSKYVVRLIRADMSGGTLEDKVRKIVEGMLKGRNVGGQSEAVRDSIMNIFRGV